ncbi:DUF167 domain-containing protein [Legionella drancourtii]|uniref:UPF0235 protein LDG_6154 n=1 Tax=Legionella drancourtii LLAP12 TaxID=658187 RepID=G9EL95_9GAMM|nr:DUF167 domain-containing protein [Legionella drancourtii]EHL31984.1 hypothetical protein LDG_6154 [Legionella drancourtii LLAP12]
MWYKRDAEQIIINLYIQPGAKHTEIAGFHGEALKIRLHAPPIEGRANEALLKFIAQIFAVPTRQVVLKRGDKSRLKTLIITGSCIDPANIG